MSYVHNFTRFFVILTSSPLLPEDRKALVCLKVLYTTVLYFGHQPVNVGLYLVLVLGPWL